MWITAWKKTRRQPWLKYFSVNLQEGMRVCLCFMQCKIQMYTLSKHKTDTATIAGSCRGNMLRQEDCSCDCPPSYFQHLDVLGEGAKDDGQWLDMIGLEIPTVYVCVFEMGVRPKKEDMSSETNR